jgi:hypothetical protein
LFFKFHDPCDSRRYKPSFGDKGDIHILTPGLSARALPQPVNVTIFMLALIAVKRSAIYSDEFNLDLVALSLHLTKFSALLVPCS